MKNNSKLGRLLHNMEQRPIHSLTATVSIIGIILIRNQLERFIWHNDLFISLEHQQLSTDYVHVIISWLTVYLGTTSIFYYIGGIPYRQAARVTLLFFPIILTPLLVDLLIGIEDGVFYQYSLSNFGYSYINLFNPAREIEFATTGVRVEIAIASIVSALYVYYRAKEECLIRSLMVFISLYTFIFILGYLPAIWSLAYNMPFEKIFATVVIKIEGASQYSVLYVLIFAALAIIHLYKISPKTVLVVKNCIRPSRLLVYLSITILGLQRGLEKTFISKEIFNPIDLTVVFLVVATIAMAFIAATALNDYFDIRADKVSNSDRLSCLSKLWRTRYVYASVTLYTASIFISTITSSTILMLAIISISIIYSSPPFRLKKNFITGSLSITSIALLCYVYGFAITWQNQTLELIDKVEVMMIAIVFFIASNFKDVKDYKGDKCDQTVTLTTLLGPEKSYWIIGFVLLLTTISLIVMVEVNAMKIFGVLVFFIAWLYLKDSEKIFPFLLLSFIFLLL